MSEKEYVTAYDIGMAILSLNKDFDEKKNSYREMVKTKLNISYGISTDIANKNKVKFVFSYYDGHDEIVYELKNGLLMYTTYGPIRQEDVLAISDIATKCINDHISYCDKFAGLDKIDYLDSFNTNLKLKFKNINQGIIVSNDKLSVTMNTIISSYIKPYEVETKYVDVLNKLLGKEELLKQAKFMYAQLPIQLQRIIEIYRMKETEKFKLMIMEKGSSKKSLTDKIKCKIKSITKKN